MLSWDRLEAACLFSSVYKLLHDTVTAGAPDAISDWDLQLKPYHLHRHSLVIEEGISWNQLR